MYQLIAAAIGFGAGAFAWSGDPIVAFILAVCALAWIASTTKRIPFWATRAWSSTLTVRPD